MVTLVALIWLFSIMDFKKSPQSTCMRQCKITLVAFVWLFSIVRFQMCPQMACWCFVTIQNLFSQFWSFVKVLQSMFQSVSLSILYICNMHNLYLSLNCLSMNCLFCLYRLYSLYFGQYLKFMRNLVNIVKLGQKCKIWTKLWNLDKSVKFEQKCKNLDESMKFEQ